MKRTWNGKQKSGLITTGNQRGGRHYKLRLDELIELTLRLSTPVLHTLSVACSCCPHKYRLRQRCLEPEPAARLPERLKRRYRYSPKAMKPGGGVAEAQAMYRRPAAQALPL